MLVALPRATLTPASLHLHPPPTQPPQPPFPQDPQPHASFAWTLGDHAAALEAALAAAEQPAAAAASEPVAAAAAAALGAAAALDVPLAQVVCRIGQRETVVWSALA